MKINHPITVLYLIDTFISVPGSPLRAGAEKQLYLLASSLDRKKFRPLIIQLSPHNSFQVISGDLKGLELFHFPTRKLYSLNGLHQIKHLLSLTKSEKVDIIQTFFEKSEVMGWLAVRFCGIPIWVTSRRDLGFKRKGIYDKIFRLTSKDCKKCIANCNAIKEIVTQRDSLPPEKIEVIYNGLDLSEFQEASKSEPLREELGIVNGAPLVGLIANFNFEIKGHGYFLGAAKEILAKIPEARFILVGDGPLRPRYEHVVRESDIEKKVYFLGKRTDVPAILSNLDISVLSSTNEGFSNVILESMAAGKPVVATNVGGSREMIKDGITGYLVPPADSQAMANAIVNLLTNPEKAVAMGEMGRKEIKEKFTVEVMVKQYEELYSSLLEDRSR